jgi:cytochrome P450
MTISSATTSPDPVVFDPISADFFDSPYETYRRLRDEAPVYHSSEYGFWALSRYEDVAAAYRDHETFSSAKGATLDNVLDAVNDDVDSQMFKVIIAMDPPEHQRMRTLVSRVFTPRAIAALEPMVRAKIAGFASTLDPKAFDVVADFSALFPVEIITTMLGVPSEHSQQIRLWLDKMLERGHGSLGPSQEGVEAGYATGAYYFDLVQQRRTQPRDDMVSRLIEAEIEEEGEIRRLDDIEITGFVSLLGGAGAETVTKLIGSAVVAFADNPDQWQSLQEDRGKLPAAVEEILRYEPPAQYNVRYTMRDVTVRGTTIPAGSAVVLLNGAANRDERVFEDPDRFDIDRKRSIGYNLGFGYGVHSCLGAALARMESRIALDTLLDLIPRYVIDRPGLERVNMINVSGWSKVPVRAI